VLCGFDLPAASFNHGMNAPLRLWPQSALHLPEGQAFIRKPPESDESGLPAVTAVDLSYHVLG